MRVAFQGEPGAYSEAAALEMLGDVETVACQAFDDVFAKVASGEVDRGVVPIENSLGGSIHRNYDLLLRNDLHIVQEHYFRVRHCLIALAGVTKADIHRVYSHPQGLAQCEAYLDQFPGIERIQTYDTAGSVKMLAEEGRRDTAAIASRLAAQIFGLEVIEEGIEDDTENYTRFLTLSREPEPAAEPAKTSIVFATSNIPGALFRALAAFSLRDIDLAKIESRPLKGQKWQYVFYLDFLGRHDSPPGSLALSQLAETASMLRVLGTYTQG